MPKRYLERTGESTKRVTHGKVYLFNGHNVQDDKGGWLQPYRVGHKYWKEVYKDADGTIGDHPNTKIDKSDTIEDKQEKQDMSVNIETKTYINGEESSTVTDDKIFKMIKNLEGEIKGLQAIETTSKKVDKKIYALKVDISKLVNFVDSRV